MANKDCPKCHGTGIVKEGGSVHTCFECLERGDLDQHSEHIQETKIKL